MAVSGAIAGTGRPSRRSMMLPRPDRLIPFPQAARLGKTPDTLRRWHGEGHLPAVIMQGQWSTYESFINAILASARPGKAGIIEDIARAWFAERGIAAEAVA
jgi:hypothetical protein